MTQDARHGEVPDAEGPVRRIAHLDMDAFYASVELLRHPQLRGRPLVIGGRRAGGGGAEHSRLADYVGRGVVTTCTYEARAFGVRSAMALMHAARSCPDALLLPADFDEYRRFSRLFKQIIRRHAPLVEDRGIDEVYIDFTPVPGGTEEGGRVLASAIQSAIREELQLTCSIGVAPNKLLAKMASEFDKPNGITILHAQDLADRIWPLPCRKINGIGPRSGEKLESLGVRTIGELAHSDPAWLASHFGRGIGAWMHEAAWGRDPRPVCTHSDPVSVSRETTFDRDLHVVRDRARLGREFTQLCEDLASQLQRHRLRGRTIGIKLRFDNWQHVTRDHTLEMSTDDARLIRRTAALCLRRAPLDRRIRLLGVRVAGLQPITDAEPTEAPHTLPLL